MIKEFTKLLKNKKYPKGKSSWHVEGILHRKTNKSYKFDLSPIQNFKDGSGGKTGFFNTKAEKMVFDFKKQWVILDIEELHEYIKEHNLKSLWMKDLIDNLTWNIVVYK